MKSTSEDLLSVAKLVIDAETFVDRSDALVRRPLDVGTEEICGRIRTR